MARRRGGRRRRRPFFAISFGPKPLYIAGAFLLAVFLLFGKNLLLPASNSSPLYGQTVFLDPGHGGRDPGACGSRYVEKDIVLKVSLALGVRLEKAGAKVVYSRTGDYDLGDTDLDDSNARLRLMESSSPTIVLSIHCNAFPDSREDGAQTFYNAQKHADSKKLATLIQEELVKETGTTREVSVRLDHFILNHSEVPTATVEIGFLSSPEEEKLLGNTRYQHRLAQSILEALLKFTESPL